MENQKPNNGQNKPLDPVQPRQTPGQDQPSNPNKPKEQNPPAGQPKPVEQEKPEIK